METSTYFDLDKAVAVWRAELARQPALAKTDLRELEAHLRDGIADLQKNNFSDEEAFVATYSRIGSPMTVAAEFAKAAPTRGWAIRISRVLGVMILGVVAAFALFMTFSTEVLRTAKSDGERASRDQAIGEMRALRTALEQFKQDNGEYPPIDNDQGSGSPYAEQNLLMALTGHARWTTDSATQQRKWETVSMDKMMNDGNTLPDGEKYDWGKAYIDIAKTEADLHSPQPKFTAELEPDSPGGIMVGAILHDPWWSGDPNANGYLYRYKTRQEINNSSTNAWTTTSFLLVSRGPDGQPENPEANFVYKLSDQNKPLPGQLDDHYRDLKLHPDLADNIVVP